MPNSIDLARALAQRCGVHDLTLSNAGNRIAETIGDPDHIIFVLVDGLGLDLIEGLPPESFLRSHVAMELRAVFPSATAAALSSLATGHWPAQHGVPGWHTWLPEYELTATILPFIERFSERPLTDLGVAPEVALPRPSLVASYTRPRLACMPAAIAGSVYSGYAQSGAAQIAYGAIGEAVDTVLGALKEQSDPSYIYLYIPHLDTAAHDHGPYHARSSRILSTLDRELGRLASRLPGGARLIVSADHGQIEVDGGTAVHIDRDEELMAMLLVPPCGEPRAPRFHLKPDADASAFRARFLERYGERFALLTTEEAEELHLFGPAVIDADVRARFGELQAIALAASALMHAGEPLAGDHGALTPQEMRIPLVLG